VTIGDGTGGTAADEVVETAGAQIADGASVVVDSSGRLDLANNSDAVGSLVLLAGSVTTGTGTLTLTGDVTSGAAAGPSTIAGKLSLAAGTHAFVVADGSAAVDLDAPAQVSGSGGIAKFGGGTLRLSGANGYAGPTTIFGGTFLVNGVQSSSAVTVNGGTLGGTGTAGPLTAVGGTVSPGASPGLLGSGSVSFGAGSTFSVELNGTTVGTEYDRLAVAGAVTLGGTLSVSLGFTPSLGSIFTILSNDGADAVAGTFAGLPEGASFALGSNALQISYAGGDGNDVTLTSVPCVSPAASNPTDQVVCPGGTATFSIMAIGVGPLAYQWRHFGMPLSDGGKVSGATTPTLTITNVAVFEEGSYDCVVTGGCPPSFTTGSATLTSSDATPPAVMPPAAGTFAQTLCE